MPEVERVMCDTFLAGRAAEGMEILPGVQPVLQRLQVNVEARLRQRRRSACQADVLYPLCMACSCQPRPPA